MRIASVFSSASAIPAPFTPHLRDVLQPTYLVGSSTIVAGRLSTSLYKIFYSSGLSVEPCRASLGHHILWIQHRCATRGSVLSSSYKAAR